MLKIENSLLVLVDVQGNLAQAMYDRENLFQNLRKTVSGLKVLEIPMIWLEQIPEKLGPTRPEIAEVMPQGLQPIPKFTFSAFGEPRFVSAFKAANRNQILLCGIESHICIYQTAIDLLANDYEVQLLTDCVSSRTPENKQLGIQKIRDAGGYLTSTEMALFELLKAAEGPKFKEIVKIVK